MYNPSFSEFLRLSKHGNVIPVYKEINADLDTPVSAFLKIKKSDYAFLLESVEGQEKIARYSFLGSNPCLVLRSKAKTVKIIRPQQNRIEEFVTEDPLADIKDLMKGFKAVTLKGLPRFCGGLVGFLSYDAVRFFERLPDKNSDDLSVPEAVFMLVDTMLVFDHVNHTIKIVSNIILPKGRKLAAPALKKMYSCAGKKIELIHKEIRSCLIKKDIPEKGKDNVLSVSSNCTKAGFKKMVEKAKGYIRQGDIIQVVLSQRFNLKLIKEPFEIYRDLRSGNPSPYMFFLKLKEAVLIGASPEMLVRCEDGIVQTRPIAGTRPRGATEEEDRKLEKELLADAKENAEHIMLVDLGRNDLGRVCMKGTVRVKEFKSVERYSHVMHIVSEVRGKLERKYDIYDALRACFPAGTVSGSPKIRAMEIIEELENVRRGPYAGCVGYFSFSHNMDTCITIRTIVVKGGSAYVQAGAGIVADSVPAKEYVESVNKAKALMEAIKSKNK